jgi:hypothetical protein
MFTIVESFDALPVVSDNEAMFFCSRENTIFVNNNGVWVSYENFVGGFEEVASVTISEDVTMVDGVLFDVAPFFEEYKKDYYYPICFFAKSLTSLDDNVFDLSIISSEEQELLSVNSYKIINPSFVFYYSLDQGFDFPFEVYNNAFNVKASNVYFEAPTTLKLFKPVGV